MAKIAFLLLCHKNPALVLGQVKTLVSSGDCVALHIDKNASAQMKQAVADGVGGLENVVLAPSVRCGWGEWSLVRATMNMITAAREAFADVTHFFLMSGDCMPVKSAHHIRACCDAQNVDFIEHADFYEDNWIKTGMTEDRVRYRHWFNERNQKHLFYGSLAVQRAFGLTREVPDGLRLKIGSQWWLLRRSTIDALLDFIDKKPSVQRFFRTTWIPDETFFQTLTMHLVPRDEVVNSSPTFLMFSDYGKPLTFYADHFDFLEGQWQFAARKISEHDQALRLRLGQLFTSTQPAQKTEQTGKQLYDYVRNRGRDGQRFAARIWESGATLGPAFRLNLVMCKKWHIGNRLVHGLSEQGVRGAFGYVFDEEQPSLPELGGYQTGRDKRNRHRRAYLRMLASHAQTNTLTICLDPSNRGAIRDFAADGCALHVLALETDHDDAWLSAHAERIGLGTAASNGALHEGLLRSLAHNIEDDWRELRALRLPHLDLLNEHASADMRTDIVSQAFDMPRALAGAIVSSETFFD